MAGSAAAYAEWHIPRTRTSAVECDTKDLHAYPRVSSTPEGMTSSSGHKNMPPEVDPGFSLQRRRKAVLVADLVESVSLRQADELGVITRWQAILAQVNQVLLPANEGWLVKSGRWVEGGVEPGRTDGNLVRAGRDVDQSGSARVSTRRR